MIRFKMESFKRLKMFPDKWWKKMTKKELHNSREQLRLYSLSKELETGINEVSTFAIIRIAVVAKLGHGNPTFLKLG